MCQVSGNQYNRGEERSRGFSQPNDPSARTALSPRHQSHLSNPPPTPHTHSSQYIYTGTSTSRKKRVDACVCRQPQSLARRHKNTRVFTQVLYFRHSGGFLHATKTSPIAGWNQGIGEKDHLRIRLRSIDAAVTISARF